MVLVFAPVVALAGLYGLFEAIGWCFLSLETVSAGNSLGGGPTGGPVGGADSGRSHCDLPVAVLM